MRKFAALFAAFAAGFLVSHATHRRPPFRHAGHHDRVLVTFPDRHHPDGRAAHTLEVVGVFPVEKPDVRNVRPDDWLLRHFDADDPQGGIIIYARPVTESK